MINTWDEIKAASAEDLNDPGKISEEKALLLKMGMAITRSPMTIALMYELDADNLPTEGTGIDLAQKLDEVFGGERFLATYNKAKEDYAKATTE